MSHVSIDGMRPPVFALIVMFATLLNTGCTTSLHSRPATTDAQGLRYYLPAPHIFMTPQSDGSLAPEIRYLQDPNNAYTLELKSYFSTATFEVKTKDGLLTSVTLDANSSATATAAIEAASEIRKSQITSEQSEKQARKAQQETKQAAITAATEAVRTQREKIALMEDKKKFYDAHPNATDAASRLQSELELSQEKLKLKQLEARLGVARSQGAPENSPFNDPSASNAASATAYGPAIFRVLPAGEGVKLVALEAQRPLVAAVGGPAAAAGTSAVTATPIRFEIKTAQTQRQLVLKFNVPVTVDLRASKLVRPSTSATIPVIDSSQLKLSGASPGNDVQIDLPSSLPPGNYRLDLTVNQEGSNRQMLSFPISWLEQ
jgi:hypothetical protein